MDSSDDDDDGETEEDDGSTSDDQADDEDDDSGDDPDDAGESDDGLTGDSGSAGDSDSSDGADSGSDSGGSDSGGSGSDDSGSSDSSSSEDSGTGDSGDSDDSGTGDDSGSGDTGTDTVNVQVISPNGGEVWKPGEEHTLTWTAETDENVDLVLEDNGTAVATIASDEPNDGSFTWTIPASVPNSGQLRFVVSTVSGSSDESDGDFTIAAWRQYTAIEVENLGGSTYSDRPFVVQLTPLNFDYTHARSNGADIRFSMGTDQDAGFEIPHWVQEWNPGGSSWVWFNLATVPPSSTTTVYMFHNNAVAMPSPDFAGVFPIQHVTSGDEVLPADESFQVDLFHVREGHTVTVTNSLTVLGQAIFIEGTVLGASTGLSGGSGLGAGGACTGCGGGGAGHGGMGGAGGRDMAESGGAGGTTYGAVNIGEFTSPEPGSGGGASSTGAAGGGGGVSVSMQGTARVFVSSTGVINVKARAGTSGTNGGGGGSGGRVIMFGAHVNVAGTINAEGGNGGNATDSNGDAGGGGGGGRVGLWYQDTFVPDPPTLDLDGGSPGTGGNADGSVAQPGSMGTSESGMINVTTSATLGAETDVTF